MANRTGIHRPVYGVYDLREGVSRRSCRGALFGAGGLNKMVRLKFFGTLPEIDSRPG